MQLNSLVAHSLSGAAATAPKHRGPAQRCQPLPAPATPPEQHTHPSIPDPQRPRPELQRRQTHRLSGVRRRRSNRHRRYKSRPHRTAGSPQQPARGDDRSNKFLRDSSRRRGTRPGRHPLGSGANRIRPVRRRTHTHARHRPGSPAAHRGPSRDAADAAKQPSRLRSRPPPTCRHNPCRAADAPRRPPRVQHRSTPPVGQRPPVSPRLSGNTRRRQQPRVPQPWD